LQRYAVVARSLSAEAGLPLVIVGSRREFETLQSVISVADQESVISLVGRTSVPELAAIVRRASLVLANNSACLHLADAFQRPMVITYSGTEHESQWRPRSSPARLLRRDTSCSPCYNFNCPYGMECLDISPEEVVQAALDLLFERQSQAT
jgi:ADP-heptose:LPS heptosyltransferase